MRTPPHLPALVRHESHDTERVPARRHPYGPHDVPVQSPPRGSLDFPAPAAAPRTEERLREIREMSAQAIGSIDDLLQHTA
ncbi:MAG: hypothetical protein HOV96_14175 [Nonomuraea sp.]|nr:hypothetical protein [Nonomuraea sp.]NUT45292.1 hypothetical protein [Thermoactinospora sp.]NUP64207.1 hypothetical protein [Nonomuraea sp.]NUP78682.1 hypothetical protein [Nonomuraea sp.]NUR91529.1 hypothetical protein [Nonomuraea sp.]